ncbi:hypothetical protein HPC49_39395 [Pyxidicoccus fallax]|uniref:Tetratricopeptide repeat protein n=1 Tax=Pyxidicoccus fallax TaxID=394095 RepID=A0A848LH12_9BACT|nr:hypothetical protein [Pyxidicoccus fallax]NMO16865.1 hypothetical protein [Pyxidicoccus fallax]NPC84266.1 hypothetical protein [Pyxidicoccus fallax]
MEFPRTRSWSRTVRRRAVWQLQPKVLRFHRSWMQPVVELTALREERDLELLDVLLSFRRHERGLALLDSAAPGLPERELAVRRAVCLCHLGRDTEARRTLVEAWNRSEDPLLAFEVSWLSKLRDWEPVVLPPSDAFDWLVAARFDARPAPLDAARAARWAESNWLFEADRKQAPMPDADVGPRYFPYEPSVALWTAVLAVLGGAPVRDTVEDALEVATRAWPELWNVLTLDPLFQPFVAPPRPEMPVLPAELSERMQLWNILELSPEPTECSATLPLGTYCPDPFELDTDPLYTLYDAVGHLRIWETREPEPPFRIEVSQHADRFDGRYDEGVLGPLRQWAPHCGEVWFFLRDINRLHADELYLRGGRYGFRRWSLADVESDPNQPFIQHVHALLRQLATHQEARFHSAEFRRALRHFLP